MLIVYICIHLLCLSYAFSQKVYGTAITFYEEYDEESLSDKQKDMLQLKPGQKWSRKSDRKILANKCICLLSRWPFFEAFKSFLFYLHKRQLMGPFDIPLERDLLSLRQKLIIFHSCHGHKKKSRNFCYSNIFTIKRIFFISIKN